MENTDTMICGDIKRGKEIGYNDRHAYIWVACPGCGKERWVGLRNKKPIYNICKSCVRKGKDNPNFGKYGKDSSNWKGGKYKDNNGYIKIWIDEKSPYFGMKDSSRYIFRSRLVMAQSLGRLLTKSEVVHHRNEIVDDDRVENLKLFKNRTKHTVYHGKLNNFLANLWIKENPDIIEKVREKFEKIGEMEYTCGLCSHFNSDTCLCGKHPKWGEMVEMDTCSDYKECD